MFIIIGLTWPRIKPMNYCTWGEHTYKENINMSIICKFSFWFLHTMTIICKFSFWFLHTLIYIIKQQVRYKIFISDFYLYLVMSYWHLLWQILDKHTIFDNFCSKLDFSSHLRLQIWCSIALRYPFSQNKWTIYIILSPFSVVKVTIFVTWDSVI